MTLPSVSLKLPANVSPERVQVTYFLTGRFGGYGGFVSSSARQTTFVVPGYVHDEAAAQIKIVVYMPGCEFVTFDLPALGQIEEQLACEPLASLPLHGKISPLSLAQGKPSEIEVTYLADWQMKFEGIYDGAVPTYKVASVPLDEYGEFDVQLPDFGRNSQSQDGEFMFLLRDPKTGNIIADLKPLPSAREARTLAVQSAYAATMEFEASKP